MTSSTTPCRKPAWPLSSESCRTLSSWYATQVSSRWTLFASLRVIRLALSCRRSRLWTLCNPTRTRSYYRLNGVRLTGRNRPARSLIGLTFSAATGRIAGR
uniref:(northern house mosquito) hypothetical protein n=1 Tax=Culex pipiens TaxID=7175 RepID=A0A8D8BCL7_CULPI